MLVAPGMGPETASTRAIATPAEADRAVRHARIAETLRRGRLVDDRLFDEMYPPDIQRLSAMHWTPVEAGVRAARLLAEHAGARLLDVGSGVGKFCIVAAASLPGAKVFGVERRGRLVDIAKSAARTIGVDVAFEPGTIADRDPEAFDGAYLFNPFAENVCSAADRIDSAVALGVGRYLRDLAETQDFLERMRIGARVVTYCGFGGDISPTHERVLSERCGGGTLDLWVKCRQLRTASSRPAFAAAGCSR